VDRRAKYGCGDVFLIVARSGLRGRGTLEEGGSNVMVRCNNVVLRWLVSARFFDQGGEEEDWDEEEKGGGVMVDCVGEQKEYDGENGREEGESFPSANFWGPGHRWIECIAQVSILLGRNLHSDEQISYCEHDTREREPDCRKL